MRSNGQGVPLGPRMAREVARRREARKCPPHPLGQLGWHHGDYATADTLICARCSEVLVRRPHVPR